MENTYLTEGSCYIFEITKYFEVNNQSNTKCFILFMLKMFNNFYQVTYLMLLIIEFYINISTPIHTVLNSTTRDIILHHTPSPSIPNSLTPIYMRRNIIKFSACCLDMFSMLFNLSFGYIVIYCPTSPNINQSECHFNYAS